MTDKLGRHGIGVGLTQYGVRDLLILDPATSAILQREGVVVSPQDAATPQGKAELRQLRIGTVINYTVYLTSGVTGSPTATPHTPATSPPASS